ncbi:Nucleoside triphosphate pyrophosphohydrolase [Alphaproteobacteria bacterium SO-S41]|nr:Nucleoside triphosphate pyrophosphohydrolase [Alphaproteobacteria bacterium SO-S41]
MTQNPGRITDLLALMARLRAPQGGCPWDLEQTFATIAPYTVEEAYEVADAIEKGDMPGLRDELGDLLFQVVFHARMAEEAGHFAFADVVDAIQTKMVRRHPHIFGDGSGEAGPRSSTEQTVNWETIKAAERAANPSRTPGVLDDVPRALPALPRALKLTKRAARVGFDWPSTDEVFAKLEEEIGELKQALADGAPRADVESELGDILFVVANLARKLGHDPETALASTNLKFVRRFNKIEQLLLKKGKNPETSTLEEMDALWDEAKREGL